MSKGVFTTKPDPTYDDLPEFRYHFPRTYLNQAKETVGDWIVYYEPRRESSDLSGRGGRQAYFATARVSRIEEDSEHPGHFYAFVTDYIEFENPVSFRSGSVYLEGGLKKSDGSTNKGAFGRSVRRLPEAEYQAILALGFTTHLARPSRDDVPEGEDTGLYDREWRETVVSRPVRDAAFQRNVRLVYDSTCAMTGLRLINGGGRCEVEAAHIQPVGDDHNGPDSIRNGIALSRTIHWMFDRGILSLSDDYDILTAPSCPDTTVGTLLNPNKKLRLPDDPLARPHPRFLRYHRERVFKG
ncbi:MAG TPA: HNH endonuclease [Thermoanaerobaculia bacterium]|nr:HNH endonuclease [Thermoanaerobaculia bacterium]